MDPYAKSALLWGLVSVLTVLVAAASAHLLFDPAGLGPAVVAAVALAAGAVVAVAAYATERRVVENGQP